MITVDDIREAEQHIIDEWGAEVGGKVVNEACLVRHVAPFNGGTKEIDDWFSKLSVSDKDIIAKIDVDTEKCRKVI